MGIFYSIFWPSGGKIIAKVWGLFLWSIERVMNFGLTQGKIGAVSWESATNFSSRV